MNLPPEKHSVSQIKTELIPKYSSNQSPCFQSKSYLTKQPGEKEKGIM